MRLASFDAFWRRLVRAFEAAFFFTLRRFQLRDSLLRFTKLTERPSLPFIIPAGLPDRFLRDYLVTLGERVARRSR